MVAMYAWPGGERGARRGAHTTSRSGPSESAEASWASQRLAIPYQFPAIGGGSPTTVGRASKEVVTGGAQPLFSLPAAATELQGGLASASRCSSWALKPLVCRKPIQMTPLSRRHPRHRPADNPPSPRCAGRAPAWSSAPGPPRPWARSARCTPPPRRPPPPADRSALSAPELRHRSW